MSNRKNASMNEAAEELFRQAEELCEKKEYEKALELFKEAADLGYVPAYAKVGMIYDGVGDFSLHDWDEALKWVRRGVQAGDPEAMYLYSHMCSMGHGFEQRRAQKGFYWMKRAYEARLKKGENPSEELRWLGHKYLRGEGVKKDTAKGLALLEESASMGNAMTMQDLGNMFFYGEKEEQDWDKALAWYKKAAEADSTDGIVMQCIAEIYESGEAQRDLDKAVEWYEKMALLSDCWRSEKAIDRLIWIYAEEKRDAEKEKYWKARKKELKPKWEAEKQKEGARMSQQRFKEDLKRAEAGNRLAMRNVAMGYLYGDDVEKDTAKALEWLEKAGDWLELVRMYREGDGVEQDLEKAADYCEKMLAEGEQSYAGEDLPALIQKLRAGDDSLSREKELNAEECLMDGRELCRRAELANRCQDYRRELALYKRAAEVEKYVPAYTKLGQIYCGGYWFPSDYETGMQWLQKGAEAGDSKAMFGLGEMYFSPYIDDGDPHKGFQLLQKSADMGCLEAMDRLAEMYSGHRGGPAKDMKKAAYWYEKMAALAGTEADTDEPSFNYCASAMKSLGNMYAEGDGVEKDIQKAIEWYEKAFAAGDNHSLQIILDMYKDGKGVEKDERKVFELYRRMADAGDASAMYEIGRMYAKGIFVERDEAKAMEWYRKGAEMPRGSVEARVKLARHYTEKHYPLQAFYWKRKADSIAVRWFSFGEPTEDSFVKIRRDTFDELWDNSNWLEMARYKAEIMGDTSEMVALGRDYIYGERGVEKDVEQGTAWYRKAAEAGDAMGINNLGYCYELGRGVDRDLAKAVKLYEKAAEMGNPNAMYHLGALCESDEYSALDAKDAMSWYRKAAKQYESRAMAALGRMAEQKGDKKTAIQWYRKAIPHYEMDAARKLANILHEGKESGLATVKEKAKKLLAVAKDSPNYAIYANIEDFIPDQYAEFLMNNTQDDMTEARIAEYLEKEKQLIGDMEKELDDYLTEEKA